MRALWMAALFLFLCTTTVSADTLTIPYIQQQLQNLYNERDALEDKAAKQSGLLNITDRQRYSEVLRDIEALEELLKIYGEGFTVWLTPEPSRP